MAERLIDANEARGILLDMIADYREEKTYSTDFAATVADDVLKNVIDAATTIDAVRVVHAKLVPSAKFGTIDPLCQTECSNCGCGHVGIVYAGGNNYCPNCGACMDGKDGDSGATQ